MVNIASKTPSHRCATATAAIIFSTPQTYDALHSATLKKGDALAVARVAGIMAAKRTSDLIPLAHPGIEIAAVVIDIDLVAPSIRSGPAAIAEQGAPSAEFGQYGGVHISATVSCTGKTGVEMEALTAASTAGLTVYDMCKGVDKGMVMQDVRVVEKQGGKSGGWRWDRRENEGRGGLVRIHTEIGREGRGPRESEATKEGNGERR